LPKIGCECEYWIQIDNFKLSHRRQNSLILISKLPKKSGDLFVKYFALNEISIQLTEVNPTIFYGGSKSKNIAILKRYFPKIKIVARGETITAYGEEEILEEFEKQMDRLIMHYGKYNSLDEDTVEKILTSSIEDNFGLDDTEMQKILHGVGGKVIKARTVNQARLVESIQTNDLVFAVGPAGTGKTYTGVAMAVKALKNKEVKRIVLTRPAVEAGENLWFLPGD